MAPAPFEEGRLMPDFNDEEWFRGMAAAAFTLAITTVEALLAHGDVNRAEAADIMEGALAALEAQQMARPENIRAMMAARLPCPRRAFPLNPRAVPQMARARSSAGEHYVDIVGVTGSIPVAPTIFCKGLGRLSCHAEEQDRAERRNSFRSIGRLPRHAPLQLGSGNGVEIECIARQLSAANNRNLPRHESARA
jgi:hypothetical protein